MTLDQAERIKRLLQEKHGLYSNVEYVHNRYIVHLPMPKIGDLNFAVPMTDKALDELVSGLVQAALALEDEQETGK